jgi:hypothetical protein
MAPISGLPLSLSLFSLGLGFRGGRIGSAGKRGSGLGEEMWEEALNSKGSTEIEPLGEAVAGDGEGRGADPGQRLSVR